MSEPQPPQPAPPADPDEGFHLVHVPADTAVHRTLSVVSVLTSIAAIAALILVVLTSRNESRDAKRQAAANAALLHRIQVERYDTAYQTCQRSNQRHDATVDTLTVIFAKDKQHPPPGFTKASVQASLASNLFLIQALSPRSQAGAGTLAQREHAACTAQAQAAIKAQPGAG